MLHFYAASAQRHTQLCLLKLNSSPDLPKVLLVEGSAPDPAQPKGSPTTSVKWTLKPHLFQEERKNVAYIWFSIKH